MRTPWFEVALFSLMACVTAETDTSPDKGEDTDGPQDTDVVSDSDTDGQVDSDTDVETAEVGYVRFQGLRESYLSQTLVSVTARFDGEPISEGFDAGMSSSDNGWFYPGADAALALPAGAYEVTLDAVYEVTPCPGCPPNEVEGSATYTLDLQAGAEHYVNLSVGPPGRQGFPIHIWSVEDTRARVGQAGVRLVGGPVPSQPLTIQEVTLATATGGCVSRSEIVVSPLWGITQIMGVPGDDTAEVWLGIEYLNPFGPSTRSWHELPDRPEGEVLTVFTGPERVAPPTEGAGVPVPAGEMTWPLCPEGPS